ncbi:MULTISPECIES: H-NS family nucleoid-associated regulatory protein [unclassified Caballeronia]
MPIFRNASGDTWDGLGDMPEWLKRAVHAGQDIEFYRV